MPAVAETLIRPPTILEVLALRHIFDPPLAIIPLLVASKIPARPWKRVIDGEPFTDDELRAMWTESINPGIACGLASELIVVDADGAEAMEYVEKNCAPTRLATDTRHGRHYYYRHLAGVKNAADVLRSKAHWTWRAREEFGLDLQIHQARDQGPEHLEAERLRVENAKAVARAKLAMGPVIDIRSDGGQVVAPGAIHPSGHVYAMVEPWTQELRDSIPVFDPRWFEGRAWQRPDAGPRKISDLRAHRHQADLQRARDSTADNRLKRASAWLAKVEGAVQGARGSDKLFYVCCRLVCGFCLRPEDAYALVMADYNPRCQPPWTEAQVEHKLEDAGAQSGHEDGYMLVDRPRPGIREIRDASPEPELPAPDGQIPGPSVAGGGGEPESDDDRRWQKRWAQFGVDYVREIRDKTKVVMRDDGGTLVLPPNTVNIAAVLEFSRTLRLDLRFNVLKYTRENHGQMITDALQDRINADLNVLWQTEIPGDRVAKAINIVCDRREFDAPREWLLSLGQWDGVPRLETMPERILGTLDDVDDGLGEKKRKENTVYGQMWRHFVTSIVARIMEPGTKVDTILFLVGAEGIFKSQLFRLLIDGDLKGQKWFTDNPFSLKDKDGRMLIGTNVLVEWSEGEHAKSAKMIDIVKSFLSSQEDEFRAPYARYIIKRPRRCVFCGTSNDDELLHDVGANRRFYIIRARHVNLSAFMAERQQQFAEALCLWRRFKAAEPGTPDYDAGRWWFEGPEDLERQTLARGFRHRSQWHDEIKGWLESRINNPEIKDKRFRLGDVFQGCLGLPTGQRTKAQEQDIRATLMLLGCEYRGMARVKRGDKSLVGRWWTTPDAAVLDQELDFVP